MLELDLYFERFIQGGKFDELSDKELTDYNELLEMEDGDILLLFQGKVILSDEGIQALINQIRNF